MATTARPGPDPAAVWAGPDGDAYHARHARHAASSERRATFWLQTGTWLCPARVLEVGAGTGLNLAGLGPAAGLRVGADVSRAACRVLRHAGRGQGVVADARALPFADGAFDLVVTCGLLIHVREDDLDGVLGELGRVASRDVLLLEYDDGTSTEREVPWRGHRDVCWARPYGLRFWRRCPDFSLRERRDLGAREGFDRVRLVRFRRRPGGARG